MLDWYSKCCGCLFVRMSDHPNPKGAQIRSPDLKLHSDSQKNGSEDLNKDMAHALILRLVCNEYKSISRQESWTYMCNSIETEIRVLSQFTATCLSFPSLFTLSHAGFISQPTVYAHLPNNRASCWPTTPEWGKNHGKMHRPCW